MTMSWKQQEWLIVFVSLLVATFAVIFLSGCYIPNPGYQTAMGLGQEKTYEYLADGSARVYGKGPQEEAFTLAEGTLVLNEEGSINIDESKITHYLTSRPSADEAAQTMAAILLANVEQSKQLNAFADRLLSTIEQVLPMLPDLIANLPTEENNERRDELIRALLERLNPP